MSMSFRPQADTDMDQVTALSVLLDRFKQEHGELMQVLIEMESHASQAEKEPNKNRAMSSLLHLRLWTLAFKEELNRHSEWEERELFPSLKVYVQQKNIPSITPSFWNLEKDHELAMNYMQTFLRAVHALKSDPEAIPVKQAAAYLTQACRILIQHLEKEEHLIYPMAEKVSTKMD